MKARIHLTKNTNYNRSFWRRAEWGIKSGAAQIVDGFVSLLSFGQLATGFTLSVVFKLTKDEARRKRNED